MRAPIEDRNSLIITRRGGAMEESDEVRPGTIAGFGGDGGVVRFEVLGRRGG